MDLEDVPVGIGSLKEKHRSEFAMDMLWIASIQPVCLQEYTYLFVSGVDFSLLVKNGNVSSVGTPMFPQALAFHPIIISHQPKKTMPHRLTIPPTSSHRVNIGQIFIS